MYFGVLWQGPRWEERVSINTKLSGKAGADFNYVGPEVGHRRAAQAEVREVREVVPYLAPGDRVPFDEQVQIMETLSKRIQRDDLSLSELDDLCEHLTGVEKLDVAR
jgi:hypothetical protein